MTTGTKFINVTTTRPFEKEMWLLYYMYLCLSDKCHHSIQGVPSISLLSNTHFVIYAKHGSYKLFRKETTQTNEDPVVTLVSL